jgi:hypothetical protein
MRVGNGSRWHAPGASAAPAVGSRGAGRRSRPFSPSEGGCGPGPREPGARRGATCPNSPQPRPSMTPTSRHVARDEWATSGGQRATIRHAARPRKRARGPGWSVWPSGSQVWGYVPARRCTPPGDAGPTRNPADALPTPPVGAHDGQRVTVGSLSPGDHTAVRGRARHGRAWRPRVPSIPSNRSPNFPHSAATRRLQHPANGGTLGVSSM